MRINPEALRAIREANGMTLTDLQREVSAIRGAHKPVSMGYLSELESGKKPGGPRMVWLLAKALGCSRGALLASPDAESEIA